MNSTMIPKDLLPIIGSYIRPSFEEYCADSDSQQLREMGKHILDLLFERQEICLVVDIDNHSKRNHLKRSP